MRQWKKQKQAVWFTSAKTERVGLDEIKVYSKPEKHNLTVSSTSSTPEELSAGVNVNYDRYMTSTDRALKPKEGMLVFVDVEPLLDDTGSLVMSEEDETIPVTQPDYILKKIIDTKRGCVARYGIKKCDGTENG